MELSITCISSFHFDQYGLSRVQKLPGKVVYVEKPYRKLFAYFDTLDVWVELTDCIDMIENLNKE